MTALRHPHSNPDAPTPSGNDQFKGFGAVALVLRRLRTGADSEAHGMTNWKQG